MHLNMSTCIVIVECMLRKIFSSDDAHMQLGEILDDTQNPISNECKHLTKNSSQCPGNFLKVTLQLYGGYQRLIHSQVYSENSLENT